MRGEELSPTQHASFRGYDLSDLRDILGFDGSELEKEADDKQGTLSVNYQGLIPVLINAIKEQQEQLKAIKSKINKI